MKFFIKPDPRDNCFQNKDENNFFLVGFEVVAMYKDPIDKISVQN